MELTAAVPTMEYFIRATSGRQFVWSATSLEDLIRQLVDRGIYAERILPYTEYEAEKAMQDDQQRLNHEHEEAIEKGDAA